jgi:hypothetical protein
MMEGQTRPTVNIFVSYSHEDCRWLREGEFDLIPWLERNLRGYPVRLLSDRELKRLPGIEYVEKIREWISGARFAILLISQNFVTSQFINQHELPWIKERVDKEQMFIIPILVGPVVRKDVPSWIDNRQIIPGEPTPLIKYTPNPFQWDQVRVEILEAIRDRLDRQPTAQPPPDGPPLTPGPSGGNEKPTQWIRLKGRVRKLLFPVSLSAAILCAAFFIVRSYYQSQPSPLPAARTVALGFSNYWQPQTHPDSRAVYRVSPLQDGQTIRIHADFDPDHPELKQGEAIVYVTQGGDKPDEVSSFELIEMTMDISVPPEIKVRFYLKDSEWRSAYWDLRVQSLAQWQHLSLDSKSNAPLWSSTGFDQRGAIALGWQFGSADYRGPAQFLVRNVQLKIRPTDRVRPVKRWPRDQFMRQCGVDLPRIFGDHDFGRPIEGGSHRGVSTQPAQLRACLDYLASKQVRLVRVSLFRDLSAGVRLDQQQRIVGLDPSVYADVDALLAETSRHPGMRLLPVLFEAPLAKRWPGLIINADERRSFCETSLRPFVARYSSSSEIYGMETVSNPEEIAAIQGDQPAREFVNEILNVIRSVRPSWKTVAGYGSRSSLEHFRFSGFDAHTFYYDPNNARHEYIKIRRDRMPFPTDGPPVFIIARLPNLSYLEENRERMPLAAYAIQDVFDYGYAGVIFSALDSSDGRLPFRGREADAFSAWMSQETGQYGLNADRKE